MSSQIASERISLLSDSPCPSLSSPLLILTWLELLRSFLLIFLAHTSFLLASHIYIFLKMHFIKKKQLFLIKKTFLFTKPFGKKFFSNLLLSKGVFSELENIQTIKHFCMH